MRLSEPMHRALVAGPLALAAAVTTLAAMPHYVPAGAGRIDNLVLPVIAFPLVWSISFFYACLADDVPRAAKTLAVVTVAQLAVIAVSLAILS
ncbi:MAG: hypothetical protein NW216_02590 [Hyphomicrobium sp.]|nr:hypothetical protein [Hyphomicrobium sp.]